MVITLLMFERNAYNFSKMGALSKTVIISRANIYKALAVPQLIALSTSLRILLTTLWGFPNGSAVKNPPAMPRTLVQFLGPELGRFPGEGNSNPLQYFCLGNPMDRGAYHRVARVGHDLATNHHHREVQTIASSFLWKVNTVTKTLLRLHGANKRQSQDLNPSSLIPESALLITILEVSLSKHSNSKSKWLTLTENDASVKC